MIRKYLLAAAAVFLAAAASMAIFYFRPVSIQDGETTHRIQPHAWTVGQALAFGGFHIDPLDRVSPALESAIPFDGRIQIERTVQAFLWENGRLRSIAGLERTPGELLTRAGVQLSSGSRLLWNGEPVALDETLPAGIPLVLQVIPALPAQIDIDGQLKEVTSSAATIARALWDSGVRISPGDLLSVEPGSPLTAGMTIAYRAAHPLTILVGEQNIQTRSAASTVGAALVETGVPLQWLDYSLPGEDEALPADGKIRVVRVREEIVLKETLIPYESKFGPDPNLELDQRGVMQAGGYGVQVTRERARYEDGKEVARGHDSDWVAAEPVAQTTGYGTKVVTRTQEVAGGSIEYWRKIHVYATSYSPCHQGLPDNRCGETTASGARLTKGIVAVPTAWFRAMKGQRVYVTGYGFATIADSGGMRGMWIDLGFDDESFAQGAFVGWVDMYFLTPVPAAIPWTLP